MDQTALAVKLVLDAWKAQNSRVDKMIASYTDEQWNRDTSTGRNSGFYLLGHLAAVNDAMLPILGFGSRLHPELEQMFLKSPDKSGQEFPSLETLKSYWKSINDTLTPQLDGLSTDDWFTRHTAVSEADFAKEPHRNKLNLVINRTIHQGYHIGQLVYLK